MSFDADLNACVLENIGPSFARELATLIGVHDLWPSASDRACFVQGVHAERRVQRVRDAPAQHCSAVPVHDHNVGMRSRVASGCR